MKFESCGFGFWFLLLLPPEHQLHTFIYLQSLTHFFFDEEIIPRSTKYRTDAVRSPIGFSSMTKRGKLEWSGKYLWYSSIVRVLPRRYSLYSRPTRSISSFILVQYPQPFVVKILMSIKNGGRLTPVLYHRSAAKTTPRHWLNLTRKERNLRHSGTGAFLSTTLFGSMNSSWMTTRRYPTSSLCFSRSANGCYCYRS